MLQKTLKATWGNFFPFQTDQAIPLHLTHDAESQ